MLLSNQACKQATPRGKAYKLSDGGGLHLLITPAGGKYWRCDYRFAGKRQTAALGTYPEVSLAEARDRRQDLRRKLDSGINPAAARKEAKLLRGFSLDATFEAVAREWHGKRKKDWSPRVANQVLRVLEKNLFSEIGGFPIKEVTPTLLLAALQKIEDRDALDLLADARSYAGQIFRYAIATGRAERDVAADLKDAFRRNKTQHHAYLTPDDLPAFLRALYGSNSGGMGVLGIKLILLTLVRTTELRAALWSEFDFKKNEWLIPATRMKMRRPHLVPLSPQAVLLLKQWRSVQVSEAKKSGKEPSPFVFPNTQVRKHPYMSENTMLKVINLLGYKDTTTVHGLRSLGSTVLHESGKFTSLMIERQLAHVDGNSVRAAYNHAEYLSQRHEMMQWWADYLDAALRKQ